MKKLGELKINLITDEERKAFILSDGTEYMLLTEKDGETYGLVDIDKEYLKKMFIRNDYGE